MAEILRKKANARIRGAEGRGPGQAVTSSLDALAGGTWVGGEVVLTALLDARRAPGPT